MTKKQPKPRGKKQVKKDRRPRSSAEQAATPSRGPRRGSDHGSSEATARSAHEAGPSKQRAPEAHGARAAKPSAKRPRDDSEQLTGIVLPLHPRHDILMVRDADRHVPITSGVPGDRVLVALPADKSPYGTPGTVEKILVPSPDRVRAACPLLDTCGGCAIQAMAPEAQRREKARVLGGILGELGTPDMAVEVAPMSHPYGYRTQLVMQANSIRGITRLGLLGRARGAFVPAEGCMVQHPLVLGVLASMVPLLHHHGVRASDKRGGWLHAVRLRLDPPSGRIAIDLAGKTPTPPGGDGLVEDLLAIRGVTSLNVCAYEKRSGYPFPGPYKHLGGARRLPTSLGDQVLHLSPGSFVQTNAEGAQKLTEAVLSLLPPAMGSLVDCYGGAGLLLLASKGRWQRATLVEQSPSAVKDLRHHLEATGQRGVALREGRVEDLIATVLTEEPEVLVLDPPRKGCGPDVMAAVADSPPPVIVYVACGFEALAKDGAALVEAGYRVTGAHAVDMFPHTLHLESVVRFELTAE